jgi:hypothetical protein
MAKSKKTTSLRHHSVHILSKDVTCFPNSLLKTKIFRQLKRPNSALIYLFLYDLAWHTEEKTFSKSWAQLQELIGLDYRAIQASVKELEGAGLIQNVMPGTSHSRNHFPVWSVPAADFDMADGGWFPVPQFVITRYCRAEPGCALLVPLIHCQNFDKMNYCWPGAGGLAKMMGWGRDRVYKSLRLISSDTLWDELTTGMPRPLQIVRRPFNENRPVKPDFECDQQNANPVILVRHYSVLPIVYLPLEADRMPGDQKAMFLASKFAEFFGIVADKPNPFRSRINSTLRRMKERNSF